jgi:hypothetical protein
MASPARTSEPWKHQNRSQTDGLCLRIAPCTSSSRDTAAQTRRPCRPESVSPRPRRWTSRPAVSVLAGAASHWPSFRSVPAAGTQRNWHRAIATVPGGRDAVTDPAQVLKRRRSGVGMGDQVFQSARCSLRCAPDGGRLQSPLLPGLNPTHFVDDPPDIYSYG